MSYPDYARFFDLAPDVLCLLDADLRFERLNAAFERLFGLPAAELIGCSFFSLIHSDDIPATRRELAALGDSATMLGFVNRLRTAAGTYRTIEWNVTRDAATGLMYAIGRDLVGADLKQAAVRADLEREREIAQALRISEQRLVEAQKLSMIGSWESNRLTEELWWSDEVYRIFEVDPARGETPANTFWERVHPADRAIVRETLAASVAQKTPYTCVHRLLMPDGRIKYVREQGRTFYDQHGTPLRTAGTVQDITAWKAADAALVLSTARFEAALEGVVAGFFILDNEWRYYFVNSVGAQMVGRTRTELEGNVIWEVFPGSVGTRFYTAYHDVMETRRPQVIHEYDSSLDRWFEAHVFPYVGGISIFFLDTTERRRAEQELELRNQAIAHALNAIIITDVAGKLVYVNAAFLRMWGYAAVADVLGRMPFEFVESDAAREILHHLRTRGAWQGELIAQRQDGTTFDALLSANAVFNADGALVNLVGSFLDISEAKRLQAQFLHAQKMESVGRLAGGVAHDFNNLLTVMKGYVDLALQNSNTDQQVFQDLQQVDAAIDSAASLTQQLLTFSRRQIIAPRLISLNEVLVRTQRMLPRLIGEDVELSLILSDPLPLVLFDPNQCEQIVINLAINARDAMPCGGKLTIETAEVFLDEEYARLHAEVQPGAYVLLAVSDTGTGMTAETRTHLFEPFFTTKEIGKGTGLGLAMVYGAVTQNGGRIEVYSELGQGTTFKIYLPCAQPGAPSQPAPVPPMIGRSTPTILLVDDDTQVRGLTSRLLEQHGYRVYAFAEGATAIHAVSVMLDPIDLLITDVIMPGMNGRILAEQLQALRPEMRVLFMSGYTTNVIGHQGGIGEGMAFLSKPFSSQALIRRVQEVLG